MKIILLLTITLLLNNCSRKLEFTKKQTVLYENRLESYKFKLLQWYSANKRLKEETKNLTLNGYIIDFLNIQPYLIVGASHAHCKYRLIASSPKESWARMQGLISYSSYKDSYTFMMFTLTNDLFNRQDLKEFYLNLGTRYTQNLAADLGKQRFNIKKNMLPYFNTINRSYEAKLTPKTINQFVEYPCDEHIVFSKYERDDNYQPLQATCYAKRLDKDVFLVTRFAHPNTQKDKKLFQTQIIPTMLKSIQATPTKLSPWEYY